ncbi:MAG: hypothetical protein IPH78_02870 [Bacteroidetes bacterium]|nr:hypothetical protein [Bacteroidota bacterium]
MKKLLPLLILLALLSESAIAQTDVYDKIADKTCDCIAKKDFSKFKKDEMQTEAGLCILSAYSELENEVPKKQKIDFKDEKSLEKLGTNIGIKMATKCPDGLMKMSGDESASESNAPSSPVSLSGTIKSYKIETYQTIVIQDKDGKNNILLWLSYFPGSDRILENKEATIGQQAEVSYVSQEIYYPTANSYVTQKVVTGITFK